MATRWTPGRDAADPHGLAAFWSIALGYAAVREGCDEFRVA
jgi:hypothetical protein